MYYMLTVVSLLISVSSRNNPNKWETRASLYTIQWGSLKFSEKLKNNLIPLTHKASYNFSTMDQYPEYLTRKQRIWHYAIHWILLAVAIVLFYADVEHEGRLLYVSSPWGDIQFSFLPVLLVGGLLGDMAGMFYVMCAFFIFVVKSPSQCFLPFIYMLVMMISYGFARHGWFCKWWKFLIAIFSIAMMLGNGWYFALVVLGRFRPDTFELLECALLVLMVLPQSLLAALILTVMFTAVPDPVKELFHVSHFFTAKYQQQYATTDFSKISRLGQRVAAIVSLVLVVVIMVSLTQSALVYEMLSRDFGQMISEEARNEVDDADHLADPNPGKVVVEEWVAQIEAEQGTTDDTSYGSSEELMPDDEVQQAVTGKITWSDSMMEFLMKMCMSILCFVIPLMYFFNAYIQHSIVLPIQRISAFMKKFAKTGDEDRMQTTEAFHDIIPPAHDEIRELFFALDVVIDDMTSNIKHLQDEHKLQEELHYAQAANQAKNQFLSNVSHEIRTPINAVIGLDEMILRDTQEETTAEYAVEIREAGHLLLSLINDILDYSKIEAGKLEILPVEYELSSVIMDVYNMMESRIREKGLHLENEINPNIPRVLIGDEIRLKQCILNILNNAIKYTEEGSIKITLGYEKSGDDEILLKAYVTDTGSGIRKEDMEKLFTPFERIDETAHRSIEGTGLGLSIVRNLLENMGSELEVQSDYGFGSTFGFQVKQKVVRWEPIGNIEQNYGLSQREKPEYHETFHAPGARILAVDDTPMNLTVLRGLLKRTQVRLDCVESGAKALSVFRLHAYDLVFLDHRMPGMDGIQTLHAMRELNDPRNRDVPIVALTANVFNTAREQYFEEGFDDYLSKPIDSVKLEELLIRHLPKAKVHILDGSGEEEKWSEEGFVPKMVPEGIDYELAVQTCGGSQILKQVAEEFRTDIESRAVRMESDVDSGNIDDFTIQVHALKSSARLLGAIRLSERAAYLESCGKRGDLVEIEQQMPYMMKDYRSYIQKLDMMLGTKQETDKPLLSQDELKYYLAGLRELAEAFDFDSLDIAINEMDGYRMPEDFKETFVKIKEAVMTVDREALLRVLKR